MPRKKNGVEADSQTIETDIKETNEPAEMTAKDNVEDVKEGEATDYTELAKQIDSEFQYGIGFMRPKWKKWITRLKLYNNQKRDDAAVGDPLLFTTFQTVFSSLYDDRLQQEWLGKEEGDEETAENLNQLSEHDYDVMEMDMVTHDWMWDTLFFGRGFVDMSEFDREDDQTTVPYVIDPLTLIRDPKAASVRGNKGRQAMRFGGYLVAMTNYDIERLPDFFNKDKLKYSETQNEIVQNHEMRQAAQGYDQTDSERNKLVGENREYLFYVWYTHYKGKKVRVLISEDRKTIHRFLELPYRYFPIADKAVYPMPGMWDGVSVPDLTEDKQRHRAAVINASLRSIKFSQNPSYIFNANTVNKNEISKSEFGNLIPVNGAPDGQVSLLPHDFVKQDVNWILDVLDGAAQRATATPDIQQGVTTDTKRTLGELQIVSSKVNNRYSLTAKLFAAGFRKFWQLWYQNYKHYFDKLIDDKVIRISGTNGAKWRVLTKENIVANIDPDVKIESKQIVEAARFNDLNVFSQFHAIAMKDPTYNIKGGLKKLARLSGIKTDELNILFRKTTDQIEAEYENELLSQNKLMDGDYKVEVLSTQNHDEHIEEHSKAAQTAAKQAHIEAHNKAKLMQRDNQSYKQFTAMNNALNPAQDPNAMAQQNAQGMTTKDMAGGLAPVGKAGTL